MKRRVSEQSYAAEYNASIDKAYVPKPKRTVDPHKSARIRRSRRIGKLIRAVNYLWLTRGERNARAFFEAVEILSKARLTQ